MKEHKMVCFHMDTADQVTNSLAQTSLTCTIVNVGKERPEWSAMLKEQYP